MDKYYNKARLQDWSGVERLSNHHPAYHNIFVLGGLLVDYNVQPKLSELSPARII